MRISGNRNPCLLPFLVMLDLSFSQTECKQPKITKNVNQKNIRKYLCGNSCKTAMNEHRCVLCENMFAATLKTNDLLHLTQFVCL